MNTRFLRLAVTVLFIVAGFAFADDSAEPKHLRHFIRFTDCEFIEAAYADGDSFRVRVDGQERVLRLYFVDAPESDIRFPLRNAEQAAYFGITPEQSVDAGKAAKAYVRTLLAGKKLIVFTRWASALGSSRLPRFYAIVEVDGRNLADLLVENGLARLHGTSVTLPDGTKPSDYLAHLAELEASARERKLGAWLHSVPAATHPDIVEVKELIETPRWLERIGFIAIGAVGMALLWGFSHWRGQKREARQAVS